MALSTKNTAAAQGSLNPLATDVIPDADGVYDIGAGSARIDDIFCRTLTASDTAAVGGVITNYVVGTFLPDKLRFDNVGIKVEGLLYPDTGATLGDATHRWAIDAATANVQTTLTVPGTAKLDTVTNNADSPMLNLATAGEVRPGASGTTTLGAASSRFASVYATTVYAATLNGSGADITSDGLVPASAAEVLGTSGNPWVTVWTQQGPGGYSRFTFTGDGVTVDSGTSVYRDAQYAEVANADFPLTKTTATFGGAVNRVVWHNNTANGLICVVSLYGTFVASSAGANMSLLVHTDPSTAPTGVGSSTRWGDDRTNTAPTGGATVGGTIAGVEVLVPAGSILYLSAYVSAGTWRIETAPSYGGVRGTIRVIGVA